jgi:hypothetical protein
MAGLTRLLTRVLHDGGIPMFSFPTLEVVMDIRMRFARGLAFATVLVSGLASAQYDAAVVRAPTARNAASYDSPDARDRRAGYIEPSSSARPGVYFFKKGVDAFKKDQTAFAIEMYETSAAYAYKPAQYNLAVMYAKGQGVAIDIPRAMAWSALAAERGDRRYVAARDAINADLNDQQVARANAILAELIPKYADETAMRKARSRWKDVKLGATGSRLGYVGTLKVGAPGNSLGTSQKSDPGAKESASLSTNAWEATGGKQADASIAYRQLRESDNPYDPKFEVRSGTVKVGEIDTNPEPSTSTTTDASEDAGSE